jgi:hypothetical protein
MDSAVQATRDTQVINADKVMARLSPMRTSSPTSSRGNAAWRGRSPLLMKANAIDLDYTGTMARRSSGDSERPQASPRYTEDINVSPAHERGRPGVQSAPAAQSPIWSGDGVQFELPKRTRRLRASCSHAERAGEPGRG